jgi:hypothetical protein
MRKIYILFLLSVIAGAGFTQAKEPTFKISDFSADMKTAFGASGYWLDGFDFMGYNSSYPTLKQMTEAEVNAVKNGNTVTKATGRYSIVGYSQGGLRALAYATALKKSYPSDFENLQSVITISGIDQGMQALENDLPGIRARILEEVRTIEGGIDAILCQSIFGQLASLSIKAVNQIFSFILTGQSFNNNVLDIVAAVLPTDFRGYVSPALRSPGKTAAELNLQQLVEMKPGSEYITTNVATVNPKTYTVRDGDRLVAEVRYVKVLFVKVPYIWIGYVPNYKTVTVNEPVYKFDADLPVGFIVGTRNSFKDKIPANVKNIAADLSSACGKARDVHIVKCCLLYGLLLGCPRYAANAEKAKILLGNLDEMVKYITRSYDGDGLVARANQYYPQFFYNPIDRTTKKLLNNVYNSGYVGVDANHAESDEHSITKSSITEIVSWGKTLKP